MRRTWLSAAVLCLFTSSCGDVPTVEEERANGNFLTYDPDAPAAAKPEIVRLDPPKPLPCAETENPQSCEVDQKGMRGQWSKALEGDYQSQRNIAFAFTTTGPMGFFQTSAVHGCAWRMAIIASGKPEVDATDMNNYQLYCGRVDQQLRANALAIAELIARRTTGEDLGSLPPLEEEFRLR